MSGPATLSSASWLDRFDVAATRGAMFLAVAMPLLMVLGNAYGDIGLSLIAFLFLLHSFCKRDWEWTKQRWVQAAALLWVYLILRSMFVPDIWLSLPRAVPWGRYWLFAAALAFWLLPDAGLRRYLLYSLGVATAWMVIDGLWQYQTGTAITGAPISIQPDGSQRLTGPFSSPRLGIMVAWLALPLLAAPLAGWWHTTSTDGRYSSRWIALVAMAVALFFSGVVIFLSGERMALLLFGLGLVTIFLMAALSWLQRGIVLGALAGGFVLLLSLADHAVLERQVGSTLDTAKHFKSSPYGLLWESGIALGNQHPLFGIGPNQFRAICPQQIDSDVPMAVRCNLHPHHLYIQWYSESGIVGLGLLLLMIGLWAGMVWKEFPRLRRDAVAVGLMAAMFVRLWPLATSTDFFSNWGAAPFWFIAGWLLAVAAHPGTQAVKTSARPE